MMKDIITSCFETSSTELGPLFEEAFHVSRATFSNRIYFSMPGMVHFDTPFFKATNPFRFPAISVTEHQCHLNCEHCKGRLLEAEGGSGCLISGGSHTDGHVPLLKYIPYIAQIKKELDLDVVIHTGLVTPQVAEALSTADIDAAMIDVLGSNETIQKVYHLNATVNDFDTSLSLLEQHHVPIVPHIVVGIHYGQLKGEAKALRIIAKHQPAAIIVVALTPLEGTPMESLAPPTPLDVTRVLLASRLSMIDTPLLLGCARPGGEHKSTTDVLAIKAGVNGIAYPSEEGYNYAQEIGLDIKFSKKCCALFNDLPSHVHPPEEVTQG
jgi:uncharacterized radical SAM superfamily protein